MYRTLKSPLNVQVEVTDDCDNLCRHCYNAWRHCDETHSKMSNEQVDIVLNELVRWQVVRCVVTGGEPFTNLEPTLRLATRARRAGMGVSINTNMTTFTPDIGRVLLGADVRTIMTSLTADTAELHDWIVQNDGAFEATTTNIQLAISMGFKVLVNMVLTQWNFDRIRAVGDLVGSWGADKFGATRGATPTSIAKAFLPYQITLEQLRESLRILYELKDKWGYAVDVFEHYPWCAMQDLNKYAYLARRKCTAGITSCSIGADGQLRPCGHSDMKYGNVFELGMQIPWMAMTDWRSQAYVAESCRKCKHFEKCGGGCPTEEQMHCDPHRTGPAHVLPIDVQPLPSIDANSHTYKLRGANLFLRDEEFGGILASGDAGVMLLGPQTFELATELSTREFCLDTLTNEFGVKEDQALGFLSRLDKEGLLVQTT